MDWAWWMCVVGGCEYVSKNMVECVIECVLKGVEE